MKRIILIPFFAGVLIFSIPGISPGSEIQKDFSPKPHEKQLPKIMHSAMKELPSVTVGRKNADLVGSDNRVLQAAVDYIAGLGGGVVEIGEGEYLMHDSLHLRSNVTVRGTKGKTVLHKADGVVSALALDGDYGEQQVTMEAPTGFAVGCGVAIWDDDAGGFHTTVARITGRNGNTFSFDNPLMADCMVHNKARAATVFPVVSAYNVEGVRIENLVIDGNKKSARRNGTDGLFLCWRVRHGLFEDNILENNGRFGISIGHKDSDNLLRCNIVRLNHQNGIFFRNESLGMAAHRNRIEENIIENNGTGGQAAGIRIRGYTNDLVFRDNTIRDTRPKGSQTQTVGLRIEEQVGKIVLEKNKIEAKTRIDDRRASKPK
jgi:polygalacturonase